MSLRLLLSSTVGITPSITTDGMNIAGETYSLVCSVAASLNPTITWLDPMNNPVSSEMVTTEIRITSTLTFDPLSASDTGTYTCRTTAGDEIQTATMVVDVLSE